VASGLTYFIGNPLVGRVAAKNESEAQFRYELTRVRENAESIALIKGADDERGRLQETFGELVARWMNVIRQHSHLTWLLNSNAFAGVPRVVSHTKVLGGRTHAGIGDADCDRIYRRAHGA
jgi:putative ATP-binding cassette transporter